MKVRALLATGGFVAVLALGGCENVFDSGNGNNSESDSGISPIEDPRVSDFDVQPGWNVSADGNGGFWTSNDHGVWRFDKPQQDWTQLPAESYEALRADEAGRVLVDGDDLWVTYGWAEDPEGIGVTVWSSPPTGGFEHYEYNNPDSFPKGPVWTVSKDTEGNIWVGTRFEVGAAYFDGNSWTQFEIENRRDRYFDCGTIVFDGNGKGYFGTWRGGLHVYNFNSEEWVHTDKGNDEPTGEPESFLDRGLYTEDLSFSDNGSSVYVSTRAWPDSEFENTDVEDADGVWKYENNTWSNLTNGVSDNVGETIGTIRDSEGRMYTYFKHDRKLRRYDGSSWSVIELEGYTPSASDYLAPYFHDGDAVWLMRVLEGEPSRTVMFSYQ